MSFDENPAAMAAHPAMRDPAGAAAGRCFPPAWYPDVGIPIPPVITANPDKVSTRPGNGPLHYGDWRGDANHHFSPHPACAQNQSKS
jgi:hypothetical protein